MATILSFDNRIEVPLDVGSFDEFRRWTHADDFPATGRIEFLGDRIEVDMSPENLFCHGTLKVEIASQLHQLVRKLELGDVFCDRTRIVCPEARLSVEPDVVVIRYESIESGRIKPISNVAEEPDQYVEFEGAPDLVVEIVSEGSVAKDERRLPPLYFAAGVDEYWLADARGDELLFNIYIRSAAEFVRQTPSAEGWQHSPTLNCDFQLSRTRSRIGAWQFDLAWRS